MKKLLLLSFAALFLGSCDSDDDSETERFYSFQNDLTIIDAPLEYIDDESELLIKSDPFDKFSVEKGDSVVFVFSEVPPEDPSIQDDEITRQLYFQIDSTLDSFELVGEGLKESPVLARIQCLFCEGSSSFKVEEGSIRGAKINETTWDITIDVIIWNEEKLVINNEFKASQIYNF